MTKNEEYYKNTIFENRVPWPNVGTILDHEDARHEAVNDAFDYASPIEISELGQPTRGQLLMLDESTRENIARDADAPLGDEVAGALRWTLAAAVDDVSVIHLLSAEEVATIERKSLTMLLDAAMPMVERDPAAYREDHPLRRLADEWRRRSDPANAR